MTLLLFCVGTKIGTFGGPGIFTRATRIFERSTDDACMVHVPGTGLLGSGHCVVMAGFTVVFHASGTAPNSSISFAPSSGPHSSPGLPPFGHAMASLGFWSLSTENIGIST